MSNSYTCLDCGEIFNSNNKAKCPECGAKTKLSPQELLETNSASLSQELDPRVKISKVIGKWGFILTLILSFVTILSAAGHHNNQSHGLKDFVDSLSSSTSTESSPTDSATDTSWIPLDFNVWPSDSNIAFKWADKNTYNCSSNYGCIQAEFLSQYGCPGGLYAAINWLDGPASSGGSVVSYSNATIPSLLPLQKAKLKFDDIEGTGKNAQMAEINCR